MPALSLILLYQLGFVVSLNQLFIRLLSNDTGGYFSKEWVPFEDIFHKLSMLSKADKPYTATALKPCFISQLQNNAGFLVAALKSEGLIKTLSGKSHLLSFEPEHYQS
ncbi:MAG: hypothetical protein GQ532_17125 [Methylomarinum sp.]|nr:hypothetical protein [Methylomarinum sp.]